MQATDSINLNTDKANTHCAEASRYACYPEPDHFSRSISSADYRQALEDSNHLPIPAQLALHLELPADWSALQTEMALIGRHLDADRQVRLINVQCNQTRLPASLLEALQQHFDLSLLDAVTLACKLEEESLSNLAQSAQRGITRWSLIAPCQPNRLLDATVAMAEGQGIEHLHLDLIYGLPNQSINDSNAGIEQALTLSPYSLTLHNAHHLPARIRRLVAMPAVHTAPNTNAEQAVREQGIALAQQHGYHYIGLDCLARADTALARARHEGRLQRCLQGYRVADEPLDHIGLGPAALSVVGDCLVENHVRHGLWAQDLANGRLPIRRGHLRDLDNRVRAIVIDRLLSDARVSFQHCERLFQFSFRPYFAQALQSLHAMSHTLPTPGLHIDDEQIRVDPNALPLLPSIAAAFDRYAQTQQPLSRIG